MFTHVDEKSRSSGKECGKPIPVPNLLDKAAEFGIQLINLDDPFELNCLRTDFNQVLHANFGDAFEIIRENMVEAFICLTSNDDLERRYNNGEFGNADSV